MSVSHSLVLEISPLGCEINYNGNKNITSIKDVIDVMKCNSGISTPFLPLGCRYYAKIGRTNIVAVEFEPKIYEVYYRGNLKSEDLTPMEDSSNIYIDALGNRLRPLEPDDVNPLHPDEKYVGVGKFKIPTPYLLYIVVLGKDNNLFFPRGQYLFALKNTLTSMEDILYTCPFSNVGRNNALCWGDLENISTMSFPNLIAISSVLDRYFGSRFNQDLDGSKWDPSYFGVDNPDNVRNIDLFRHLNGQQEFPFQILKRSRYTLQSFVTDSILVNYT